MEGIRDARPRIRSALERAERFLNLAALTSVLLAAAAIALAARRYLQRHLDGCAIMRCLGATQARIMRLHFWQFTLLGLLAAGAGMLAGVAAQALLAAWLSQVVSAALPAPGVVPALHGIAVGLLLLLGFALPPLLGLRQVPTLRVLRRELGPPGGGGTMAYVAGGIVIGSLILWRAEDLRFGFTVLAWFVTAMGAAVGLSWLLLSAIALARGRGVAWRCGIAAMQRRRLGTVVQVVALGLGMMALLTLTLIRADLLRTWQASLPPDAPNRFVINIQPDQTEAVGRFFAGHGMAAPALHPMVRGRLVGINERGVIADAFEDERARRLANREFNLSWAAAMQPDNRVVAGAWWDGGAGEPGARGDQFSVEKGLAEALGIRMGDVLTFDIAGRRVTGAVASLRSVEWDSFNVNFFVLARPGLLEGYPATYVTSLHLPRQQVGVLNAFVKAFPNVVLIDVAQALAQVQVLMEQAARAVQFVFLFTLLAGLAVLYAALAGTQDERVYQAVIMRILGASRGQINRAHLAEFAIIGATAGVVAAGGATGLAAFLARRFLELEYAPNPAIWVIAVSGGALGVAVAGYLGTRRVLEVAPLSVLRGLG
jgi:putative ABC transport system permease protein